MHDYESLSHTRWECKYHVVFIPKYRRKVQERAGSVGRFDGKWAPNERAAANFVRVVYNSFRRL
jgi:REP element-mobilizing transposase RayT